MGAFDGGCRGFAQGETRGAGGGRSLQYRNKSGDHRRRRQEAGQLATLCRQHDVPLIINDDVELALAIDADGVHLGRDDGDPQRTRARLGADRLIGVSCYNDFDRAVTAAAQGADYIAFGSFFGSPTKPQAVRATPDLLKRARRELSLPAVAIGGITPENGGALVRAGADMLAVITAVFDQPDVLGAARRFAHLFDPSEDTIP